MSKTETQTEAQRLGDQLRALGFGGTCILAAEELGRLDAEVRDLKMAVSHESLCVEAAKERIRQLDAENKVLRAAVAGTVPVVLGKKLFSFRCHQDWVSRAQRAWKMAGVRSEHTICLDQKGRVLLKGLEFRRADEEGAFPVDVYLALVDDTAAHDAWLAAKNGGAA